MEPNEATAPLAVHGAALVEVLALRKRQSFVEQWDSEPWIAQHLELFADAYRTPRALAALPPECPFRRAERAFTRWIWEMRPDRSRDDFRDALFALPGEALPDLDRFALGTMLADGEASRRYLAYSLRAETPRARLVRWLTKDASPTELETLFTLTLGARPARFDLLLAVWQLGEANDEVWKTAAAVVDCRVSDLREPDFARLLATAWTRWPAHRRALLFTIERLAGKTFTGADARLTFTSTIGDLPTDEDLSALLSLGDGYRSLGDGYRASIIWSRLPGIWALFAGPAPEAAVARVLHGTAGFFGGPHVLATWLWQNHDLDHLHKLQAAFDLPREDRTLPSDLDLADLCHDRGNPAFTRARCTRLRAEEKEEERRLTLRRRSRHRG